MKNTLKPLWLLVLMAAPIIGAEIPHFTNNEEAALLAARLVEAMNDHEALGQTLMFGYHGETPDSSIIRAINRDFLGGVKVFGKNAENLSTLAKTITVYQRTALGLRFGIPLFISTDQEGGWVRHIKGASAITPGNMSLGANPIPEDARETGRIIGRELAAVGVNMNFAPTVDVFVDPKADVIGPRAFMANPGWSGILGLAFARGQEEFGVVSTAKHFPGHGDTADDSHGTLPIVRASLDTLRHRDWVPYRIMIKAGLPAVMVGHLAFPGITDATTPATLSKIFITNLLKGELGFTGIVVTDDLFMRGARVNGESMSEVAYQALQAGADLILISETPAANRAVFSRLSREMSRDATFNARVRDAALRIVTIKLQYLKGANKVPWFPEAPAEIFASEETRTFLLNQAARSITLVHGERFPIPPQSAGKVLLAASYPDFFTEGRKRYPNAASWHLGYANTIQELKQKGRSLARAAANYDTVIVLLPDAATAILLNELKPHANHTAIISILSPTHLSRLSWAQTAIAAYGTGIETFQAAFAALAGDFEPQGQLPVPIETGKTE
ncbi:MAG: hypothetical protein B0D92_02015 [Spirochaeta sp. LUC14_002_19_P3]|nr:MAG: hypothetical protein B0D92_02015 [Spirochaeta sp. LUC14_002_19_P3]